MSFHISIKKVLCCLSFVIYGSVPSSALSITYPVYIDVSSGIPTVSSPSPFFWTAGPFDGLHSSVTQLAPGAWAIDIGLVGAWRSWGTQFGLELTDPQTGAVIDSFGIYGGWYNNLYSWTTLKTELFTTDNSGQLAGRYRHSDIALNPCPAPANRLASMGFRRFCAHPPGEVGGHLR